MLLTGHNEEFHINKNDKVSMTSWNPLLVAIAYKRLDIVRYFLQEMHIALRHFGKSPDAPAGSSAEEMAASQVYSLLLAIYNKDLKMFADLWNVYTAWDETHLQRVIQELVKEKWHQGLLQILRSQNTEILFSSQLHDRQVEIIKSWGKLRKDCGS